MPTNLTMGMRMLSTIYGGVAATPKSTLVNGLVSYWSLDEASGTRVDSIAASGNDLTDNNTVGSAPGMHNAAASFVAANSESLTGTALDLSSDFHLSFWCYPSGDANWMPWAQSASGVMYLIIYTSGVTQFVRQTAGTPPYTQLDLTKSVTSGGWHLIELESSGSNILAWVDGEAAGTQALNGAPAGNSDALTFGSMFTYKSSSLIDEAAFWSRVLTDPEIAELFNLGAGKFYNSVTENFE